MFEWKSILKTPSTWKIIFYFALPSLSNRRKTREKYENAFRMNSSEIYDWKLHFLQAYENKLNTLKKFYVTVIFSHFVKWKVRWWENSQVHLKNYTYRYKKKF